MLGSQHFHKATEALPRQVCHVDGICLRWDMSVSLTVEDWLQPESSAVGCLQLMDVDANAEQDDRFPLESMSGGFAERK